MRRLSLADWEGGKEGERGREGEGERNGVGMELENGGEGGGGRCV